MGMEINKVLTICSWKKTSRITVKELGPHDCTSLTVTSLGSLLGRSHGLKRQGLR